MARGSRPRVRWHNDRVRKNKARLKRRAAAAGAAREAGQTGAQARRSTRGTTLTAGEAESPAGH